MFSSTVMNSDVAPEYLSVTPASRPHGNCVSFISAAAECAMGIDTFATIELMITASFSVHSSYASRAAVTLTSHSGITMPLKNAAGLYIAFFSAWYRW